MVLVTEPTSGFINAIQTTSGFWPQASGSTGTGDGIWSNWNSTTTTGGTTNTIWITWVEGSNLITTNGIVGTGGGAGGCSSTTIRCGGGNGAALTPEQLVAQEQQRVEQAQRYAEADEQRKAALARSMALLRENLSVKQLKALDKHGWFLVEGGQSKKTYRIHGDRFSGNIAELDGKQKEVARYCVHLDRNYPLGDQLLAQAMSLKWDEDHIIKTANRL